MIHRVTRRQAREITALANRAHRAGLYSSPRSAQLDFLDALREGVRLAEVEKGVEAAEVDAALRGERGATMPADPRPRPLLNAASPEVRAALLRLYSRAEAEVFLARPAPIFDGKRGADVSDERVLAVLESLESGAFL